MTTFSLDGFEKFIGTRQSFCPKISIRGRGQIGFNRGAIKRFNLNSFTCAFLYISHDRSRIAIKFLQKLDPGAISMYKKPANFYLKGKSFLDFYKIDYTITASYTCLWDCRENIAIIEIGKSKRSY